MVLERSILNINCTNRDVEISSNQIKQITNFLWFSLIVHMLNIFSNPGDKRQYVNVVGSI